MLTTASTFFLAASAAADVHKIATVNYWVGISFVFALAGFVQDLWKYVKRWVPKERLAF